MRKYLPVLVTLLALSRLGQFQVQQETKRLPGGLLIYGPVHTIRDERTSFTLVNGQLVEGKRELWMTATYSEDGTKQERIVYVQGTIYFRMEDTFALDGRSLETRMFRGTDLESRTVSVYNERKELVERVTYRPDDSVWKRTTFVGDPRQVQIETVEYDAHGRIINQSSTRNDKQTRETKSISVSPGRVFESLTSQTSSPDGTQEFRDERSDGSSSRRKIIPDGKGGEDRIHYNEDGMIKEKFRVVREFDSYSNMVKTTRLRAAGDSDFRPDRITYRTITYYQKN